MAIPGAVRDLCALPAMPDAATATPAPATSRAKYERGPRVKAVEGPVPFPSPKKGEFTFIDLFAGIGGFRLALQSLGGKCVFTSEWDAAAQKTYEANFGDKPHGDITKIDEKSVPDHDVLCAGFPCQAFSIAGKRRGFDETRGTLFFDVARIIREKRPRVLLLENVKGLMNHDQGHTLATILRVLREDLGYTVPEPRIVNARHHGVPQNRERIFIVGFRDAADAPAFAYPANSAKRPKLADILEGETVSARYYLSTQYLGCLRAHKDRHAGKGNGFGFEVIPHDGTANAIVVGGMGKERNLVVDTRLTDFTPVTRIKGEVNREGLRRMTPREWARLQGFPDAYRIVCADAQSYKQFGNSVAVPAVRAVANALLSAAKII